MSVTIKAPSITIEAQGSLALKGAQRRGHQVSQGPAAVNVSGAIINLG